jgi:predicted hydrolase (HD superfamily)
LRGWPEVAAGATAAAREAGAERARGPGEAGFFVLPVDCPLVLPNTLRSMMDHFEGGHHGILYPTCCGRRGHPPLVAWRYAGALLAADDRSDLRTFLGRFCNDEANLDVRDLAILMDMDTPEDCRTLDHLAMAQDAARSGRGTASEPCVQTSEPRVATSEPALTAEDALYIMRVLETPDNVVRHCQAVGAVAEALARALKPHVPAIDVARVLAGGLLHDMTRLIPAHALVAEQVLSNLGLPELGAVVGEHMVLHPERPAALAVTEHEVVYLADKLVADDELVGLDERQARALRKMGPEPGGAERIAARIADARVISQKIEGILGRSVSEILDATSRP